METRYYFPSKQIDNLPTGELRKQFLIDGLFLPGEVRVAHTGLDRLVVAGVVPAPGVEAGFPDGDRTSLLNGRRETGIINIGDPGQITVDGKAFNVGRLECLYIGLSAGQISFRSEPAGQAEFYVLSCPAHRDYPTRLAKQCEALATEAGDSRNASRRKIFRYIHENGIQSCQLVMGYTELESGSVWNTWPPHTHFRRSEIYLYFDLGSDPLLHLVGEPEHTKHIVVRDREAVLSPPWSINCGVGTRSYRFIWGMAGENQTFEDMDPVELGSLR
jgi:4-deoxy-L-threo-5-hexosulose-uronate ketol-isomerase